MGYFCMSISSHHTSIAAAVRATMSGMSTHSQRGYINILLVPLIVAVLLLVGVASFGAWAYSSRQDYKNHSDTKAAAAAAVAAADTKAKDDVRHAEEDKNPLRTFVGPEAYGSVTVQYPKTWSSYVVEGAAAPLDAYYHPDYVPDISDDSNAMALRMQIVQRPYSQVIAAYTTPVQGKKLAAQPYSFPKVPSVVGTRFDGQLSQSQQGTLVVVPLRNVTLEVWTESASYATDFNNTILANLTFSP